MTASKSADGGAKNGPPSALGSAKSAELRKAHGRSRVTNASLHGSTKWLDRADRRSPVARRFKDLIALITSDCGGLGATSELQRQIIRRAASLAIWCESQEAEMADGHEIDILRFGRTSNSLRRLAETLGLSRVPKDITPSLGDILREGLRQDREARVAEDAEEVEA